MQPLVDQQQQQVWDHRMAEIARHSPNPDPMFLKLMGSLNLAPRRALDLGCGPGRHLVWLAQNGWQVTGLDWSGQALADANYAISKLGLKANLVKGDLREPPDLGPGFDLVVATRVFHHGLFEVFIQAMKSLRSLLAPGDHAIISLPSASRIPLTWTGRWVEPNTYVPTEGDESGVPHHFFTPAEVFSQTGSFSATEIHQIGEEYTETTGSGRRPVKREWLWVVLKG